MGDGADDALDMALTLLDDEEDDEVERDPELGGRGMSYVPKRTHWVTRTGERVRINEMTDSHLRNTIRMLQRRVSVEAEWPELVEEARDRGIWKKGPEAA